MKRLLGLVRVTNIKYWFISHICFCIYFTRSTHSFKQSTGKYPHGPGLKYFKPIRLLCSVDDVEPSFGVSHVVPLHRHSVLNQKALYEWITPQSWRWRNENEWHHYSQQFNLRAVFLYAGWLFIILYPAYKNFTISHVYNTTPHVFNTTSHVFNTTSLTLLDMLFFKKHFFSSFLWKMKDIKLYVFCNIFCMFLW